MSNTLEAINQDFDEKFHLFFQKPELIQGPLNQRSKEFDLIITKQFKKLRLDDEFAIVALGGYGRNELFPGSDIDLSIIQLVKNTSKLEEVGNFIAWLWTLNVKIGHSVRTIKDIEKIARQYKIFRLKVGEGVSYTIDHSSAIYLVDKKGDVRLRYPYGFKIEEIVEVIKKLID